jgi:hypothetical protein
VKPFLFSAALLLFASLNLHATEALLFNGGGYNMQIMVGYDDNPVVAQILFTPPGAKDWVVLPRESLKVKKFDMEKRILTIRFSNESNPDLPGSFSFSVKDTKAVLSISGKEIKSDFNWDI